jgi:tetratricopeptide (TPR) repeat protein
MSLTWGAPKNLEVISKLKQNIERIDNSISITKEKVKSPKEVEFLPDIYFSLAELYIEKARYMFALKLEVKAGTPVEEIDFTAEKRVKQEAIDTLQSLNERYPRYPNRDRVLFAIGHEYREINDNAKAMKFYKEITDKYPDSTFWAESQYLLGLIFFEKKDYEFAKQQFQKITVKPEGNFHAQAYFKIGQCDIFADQYLNAMLSFEKALKSGELDTPDNLKVNKKDIREEVLIASVVPLTDLTSQDLSQHPKFLNSIDYYRELAYDKASYRRVLQRLGRRLNVKSRFAEAAKVNYELMKLSSDPQQKKDAFEAYYLSMKQSKKDYFPESIQVDLNEAFRLMSMDGVEYTKYEPAFRDIATKIHQNSNATNRIEDFKMVVELYENYLTYFPKSKFLWDMKINLAEALFKSEKYIESSINYFALAKVTKNATKAKDYYLSSLQSLEKSFEISHDLPVIERFQSRAKYREIGAKFLKSFANRNDASRISFNIAKTYYDEKNFEAAVKSLRNFVFKYPNDAQSTQAVLLLLDTYYIRDDLKGLVSEGNALVSKIQFNPQTRAKVQELVQQAQLKNVKSLAGDFGSKKYADDIIKFAKSNKNSTLGESALFEAFTALKSQNDEKAFEVGEDYLASFPKSNKAKEILLTMTQMSLISVDMRRAQRYLTAFAQKFPDDGQSSGYLQQAALIAEQSGDLPEAARIYRVIGNTDKQVNVLFLDSNWQELQNVASRVSGPKGIYYSGLAMYRIGKKNEGLNLLRRLQNVTSNDFETKSQIAHANYILAFEDLQVFKTISVGGNFTPQVLKNKIQAYQEVDKQIQTIIKFGIGRWALAALYLSGKLNQEMVQYLRAVPTPPGMAPEQLRKVLDPQIKKYQANATAVFSQCLQTGEENDIFTLFVEGCRLQGSVLISEEKDLQKKMKLNNRSLASDSTALIRKQIYKDPRNVKFIRPLVKSYVEKGDYSAALSTLGRLQEVDPQNQTWKAEMGVVSMYMNNLDDSFTFFNEAYSKDSNNKTALWGLKALYKKFNYNGKLRSFVAKAKSVGRPDGIIHPWMEN